MPPPFFCGRHAVNTSAALFAEHLAPLRTPPFSDRYTGHLGDASYVILGLAESPAEGSQWKVNLEVVQSPNLLQKKKKKKTWAAMTGKPVDC